MKKIFTLTLAALFLGGVGNVFAQEEEDMTSYIINAGFDEDLTWNADGSKKQKTPEDLSGLKRLSDRSLAWKTDDGSLYAVVNPTTPKSRQDGQTLRATNGFAGQIKGWEWADKSRETSENSEWVYFGTVAYGLGETAIPVADDGATYLPGPTEPTDFEGGTGALLLRAGWGGSFSYKQVVKLPCAEYRLEYWTINVNPNTTAEATDLSKITCRKDVFKEEGGTALTAKTWTKHSFEFTPTTEFTIEFGFKAGNGGSGATPWVYIDGIKLYKIGEADAADLAQSDITDTANELTEEVAYAEPYVNYAGIVKEIEEVSEAAIDYTLEDHSLEELTAKLQELQAYQEKLTTLKDSLTAYEEAIAEAQALLEDETIQYPGFADFETAIGSLKDDANALGTDGWKALMERVKKAIADYRFSQEASEEHPADYTFYIQSPYFTKEEAKPTITYANNGTIEAIDYPNASTYTTGNPPADGTSDGWYKAGTTEGDQRLNWNQGRVCWNAWRTNAEDVAVAQDLTGLPNGYYTLSAEMITQPDYVSNQHIFANGSVQKAESPALEVGNYIDGGNGEWTYLTTKKVLVVDGKLTIGALGSAKTTINEETGKEEKTTNQNGWFLVTNFRLNYLGTASEEDMAAAIQKAFNDATEKAATMHLAGDKAIVTDSISKAKAMDDVAKGLEALNGAMKLCDASEAKYEGALTGSYADMKKAIAEDPDYSADAKTLAQVPVDYMTAFLTSEDASYEEVDAITAVLRHYRDTLIPTLQKAEGAKEACKTEAGKAAITGTIEKVKENLATYTSKTSYLDEQVAALNNAVNQAEKTDIDIADNTDMTAFVANPAINSIDGWTFIKTKGDGNGRKSGQAYDGDGSNGYIDTYNSGGGLRETIYQELEVPNGTYQLKSLMRAPGTGLYLFMSDKSPIKTGEGTNEVTTLDPTANTALAAATNVKTNMTHYVNNEQKNEDGSDVISGDVADAYGEIWMAAIDALGITNPGDCSTGAPIPMADILSDLYPDPTPAQEELINIATANGGKGRGWFRNTIESFEVTNHKLVIGVTCDYKFLNKAEDEAYTGTWFSADDFELTLVKAGDNDGWNPATGIEAVDATIASDKSQATYNLNGQRVGANYKGIVIKGGKKVLVK